MVMPMVHRKLHRLPRLEGATPTAAGPMAAAEGGREVHREAHLVVHQEARTADISPANRQKNLSLLRVLASEPCPQEAHLEAHREAQEVRVEVVAGEEMMMTILLHSCQVTMAKTMSQIRLASWK